MWIYFLVLLSMALCLEAYQGIKFWNQRIVNGKPIDIGSAPWQVALLNRSEHFCGGTIYSEDIVITAAQCLSNINVAQLTVRAGSSNWHSGGQLVKVADFRIHQHFGPETHENDIGVLRLLRPLRLGDSAQAIVLADEEPVNEAEAFVSGWGDLKIDESCQRPRELQGVCLKIVDRRTCALSMYALIGWEITKDMICATDQGKDSCGTDAGGPLVSNKKLVGIVSWGEGCAKPGFPGVYANVAYFKDWLANAIGKLKGHTTTSTIPPSTNFNMFL